MSGVYSVSTTVDITFIFPKLDLKKSTKKQLNFSDSIICSVWKLSNYSSFFFHLSFPKLLYISVLLSIVKVPYRSVLLSIITCRHLLLADHTQKHFVKALYYLAKTWLSLI